MSDMVGQQSCCLDRRYLSQSITPHENQILDSICGPFYHHEEMSTSFSQRVKIPDHVLVSDLQGESVILNVNSERYYGLDRVGTRFLTLLSDSDSIELAFEALLAEYDVDADTLRADITDLLNDLSEQGLVEISD